MKSNKLLILVLIFLVIISLTIITNLFSYAKIDSSLTDQLKENQQIKTENAANQIESHIRQVKDELIVISQFPAVDTVVSIDCHDEISFVSDKILGKTESILRSNSNGDVIECAPKEFSDYLGLNIKNKDYYQVPKKTNEAFISEIVRQGDTKFVIISVPLFQTTKYTPYPNFLGEFKGIIFSFVEVAHLRSLYLHPVSDPEKNLFMLVNLNTNETILKSNSLKEYSETQNSLQITTSEFSKIINIAGLGRTIVTSSDLIFGREKWRLIVLTPLKNVQSELASVQLRNLFSLGFVLVVIIALFAFLISLLRSKEQVQSKLAKTNVTLEKLGINIEIEEDKFSQADINLEAKRVYLLKEDDDNHAHELFISSLNKGFAGLGIVRDNPKDIKKKYNLLKTSFIWLTNNKVDDIPCESNINNLYDLIKQFVENSKKSVILIDRLDYILNENEFEDVIHKIHELKDLVQNHECIIIMSLNPELIDESKLKAIEVETIDLFGKYLKQKIALSEIEMNILNFINESNVTNKLVSYKDITDNFNITKPTTRVKISNLQSLCLVLVEQRGRFKSLKITSSGRKLIG